LSASEFSITDSSEVTVTKTILEDDLNAFGNEAKTGVEFRSPKFVSPARHPPKEGFPIGDGEEAAPGNRDEKA
jgi:hypothetical protein